MQMKESFPVVVTHVPPFWHKFTLQESPVKEEINILLVLFTYRWFFFLLTAVVCDVSVVSGENYLHDHFEEI